MPTKVGLFEAKQKLSELVERASRGEEIIITCRGEGKARLVRTESHDTPPSFSVVSRSSPDN